MSATGELLIIGIGLNIQNIKEIRVGNLLPAIFYAAPWLSGCQKLCQTDLWHCFT
jgi:uncharacterized membrane protein YqgA involved in biofilm formation